MIMRSKMRRVIRQALRIAVEVMAMFTSEGTACTRAASNSKPLVLARPCMVGRQWGAIVLLNNTQRAHNN